ncbi:hypothetical protein Bbelb_236270 [Branchiostoma belcheri]|nr:hypothetical protein Bbelb_236270 [Branchiostoma belcheri]
MCGVVWRSVRVIDSESRGPGRVRVLTCHRSCALGKGSLHDFPHFAQGDVKVTQGTPFLGDNKETCFLITTFNKSLDILQRKIDTGPPAVNDWHQDLIASTRPSYGNTDGLASPAAAEAQCVPTGNASVRLSASAELSRELDEFLADCLAPRAVQRYRPDRVSDRPTAAGQFDSREGRDRGRCGIHPMEAFDNGFRTGSYRNVRPGPKPVIERYRGPGYDLAIKDIITCDYISGGDPLKLIEAHLAQTHTQKFRRREIGQAASRLSKDFVLFTISDQRSPLRIKKGCKISRGGGDAGNRAVVALGVHKNLLGLVGCCTVVVDHLYLIDVSLP